MRIIHALIFLLASPLIILLHFIVLCLGGFKSLGTVYVNTGLQWLPKSQRDCIKAIMTSMKISEAQRELNETMNES